ncbi:hypothetical protein SCB17_003125 [Clostridium perfringens]|nr:hypothetical protein [Clostridium perfringens]
MRASELFDTDLAILKDYIVAHIKAEEEELDKQMQVIAWQTALLMNSTGNYKKSIKPTDLYTSIFEEDNTPAGVHKVENKKALEEELLQTFKGARVE